MTYKQFEKHLQDIIQFDKNIDAVQKAMKQLDPDFGGFYLGNIQGMIVDILKTAMNDDSDYISYWIYDLEYGSKWKKGKITDKHGKDIPLKTIKKLYNAIKPNTKTTV